ncbi:hypothetical protein GF371_04140 [Candidatus Woesearchaeota archaeon]|nr:hypothetical protein [Candidatus Woesearchaeota archaeon]
MSRKSKRNRKHSKKKRQKKTELKKIGVVSDLHGNISAARNFAKYFLKHPVDAVVLNGDLSEIGEEDSVKDIVLCFKKLKCPVYVIPGSHESWKQYRKLKRIKKNNIIDCFKMSNRKKKLDSYDLVFMPGSDFLSHNADFKMLSGRKELEDAEYIYERYERRTLKFSFIEDLFNLVKNPEKTIVVSHVPPLFRKGNAIYVAKFVKIPRKFKIKEKDLEKSDLILNMFLREGPVVEKSDQSLITLDMAKELRKFKYPAKIYKANRGNKNLAKAIKMLKVTKMICGHFHESGSKGCDSDGKYVSPNKKVKSLFYNSGPGFEGLGGIYFIHDGKVSYRNIKVKWK